MSIDTVVKAFAAQRAAPGLVTQAVQRQQTADLIAIKTQAKSEQAVVDMVSKAVQQAQQAIPGSGTPSPVPARGSTVNILV